jgi:hypothetical protein
MAYTCHERIRGAATAQAGRAVGPHRDRTDAQHDCTGRAIDVPEERFPTPAGDYVGLPISISGHDLVATRTPGQ